MRKIIRISTVPLSLSLFCRGLLKELSSEYEVVAVSSPGPELDEVARREDVRTVSVPMRRRIALPADAVALWRLVRLFRRERPQMVHSITPKAGLLSMMAALIAGVPVRLHTFTGLLFPTASGFKKRLLMLTDRITCLCATHVMAEGCGVRNDLIQYGICRKPVSVLGYGNIRGIDLSYYDRTPDIAAKAGGIRESLGASDTAFVFLFVGRIARDKGIDELLEAFCRVESDGFDVRLLLAGDEETEDPISDQSRRIIEKRPTVCKIGWQEDVRPYYAAADAFVFPSRREGFPNAVIEAGAMGLPSIVTDINGSREIVVNGRNGVVVPPCDCGQLHAAMEDFILRPDHRADMAHRARPMVAERYAQGFVREKLKEYYREILNV